MEKSRKQIDQTIRNLTSNTYKLYLLDRITIEILNTLMREEKPMPIAKSSSLSLNFELEKQK